MNMKKKIAILSILGLWLGVAWSQHINVIKTTIVSDSKTQSFTAPQFSPDGTKLLFSEAGFKGLWIYDLKSGKTEQLNDYIGAGYEPTFSKDSKQVIFHVDNYVNYKRYSSLAIQTIGEQKTDFIEKDSRFLSPASVQEDKTIIYRKDRDIATYNTTLKSATQSKTPTETYGYIEDQKIVVVVKGVRRELTPLGDGNYIWFSLSPDKTKMLFTVAGGGTFVTDLAGNILVKLGKANAPKWSPDGNWILYMVDEDDGHTMTASDIWAVTSDGVSKIQLTKTAEDIEMYPNWAPAMDKIVYETFGGKIVFINIEIAD